MTDLRALAERALIEGSPVVAQVYATLEAAAATDRLTAEVHALRLVQEDAMRLATGVVLHGDDGAAA